MQERAHERACSTEWCEHAMRRVLPLIVNKIVNRSRRAYIPSVRAQFSPRMSVPNVTFVQRDT